MSRFFSQFFSVLQSALLVLVAFHLCFATIPRCDNIRSLTETEEAEHAVSCHSTVPATSDQDLLHEDRLCRCELLRYFLSTLPSWGYPGLPPPAFAVAPEAIFPYDLGAQDLVFDEPGPPPRHTKSFFI